VTARRAADDGISWQAASQRALHRPPDDVEPRGWNPIL